MKVRASQVGKIMPGVRKSWLKSTEDYLVELWVQETFGREKDVYSKYMEKGTRQEEEAITLLSEIKAELFFKNEQDFENEWITGTPDILKGKVVRDVKCSWDIFTFISTKYGKLNQDYYWQLQSYMDLTGAEIAYLDYCLVDTPLNLIDKEKRNIEYNLELTNQQDLLAAKSEINRSMTYSDIPKKDRVYTIEIERNEDDIQRIHERVELCRQWIEKTLQPLKITQ